MDWEKTQFFQNTLLNKTYKPGGLSGQVDVLEVLGNRHDVGGLQHDSHRRALAGDAAYKALHSRSWAGKKKLMKAVINLSVVDRVSHNSEK